MCIRDRVKPKILIQKQGSCFAQSKRIIREEAWRCVSEGETYDPCFVKPGGNQQEALCLKSPWLEEAVLIKTKDSLDASTLLRLDISSAYPWAVLLSSGEQCLSTDKEKTLEGSVIHYQCSDRTLLFGYLQRCREEWSMLHQKQTEEISTAVIKKAWF